MQPGFALLNALRGSGSQTLLDLGLGRGHFSRQVVGQLGEQLVMQLELLRPGGDGREDQRDGGEQPDAQAAKTPTRPNSSSSRNAMYSFTRS